VQVLGSLLLVFGCLFGLLFLLKKMNALPVSDRQDIRIMGSLKVGTREKILLLKTGDSQLLVGVAAGNIRTLHVFDTSAVSAGDNSAHAADFSTLLQRDTPVGGGQ